MIKHIKAFVDWFLKFYWAFFYIWIITVMQMVKMNVPVGLVSLRNWLIVITGAVFAIGFLSLWAGGYDFLKK